MDRNLERQPIAPGRRRRCILYPDLLLYAEHAVLPAQSIPLLGSPPRWRKPSSGSVCLIHFRNDKGNYQVCSRRSSRSVTPLLHRISGNTRIALRTVIDYLSRPTGINEVTFVLFTPADSPRTNRFSIYCCWSIDSRPVPACYRPMGCEIAGVR